MKVNSSMLGLGHEWLAVVSVLKKSLGSLELEATRTRLLLRYLELLVGLRKSYFYLPSSMEKKISLANRL